MPHPPQGAASSKKRVGKISSPFLPPNFHPPPPQTRIVNAAASQHERRTSKLHGFNSFFFLNPSLRGKPTHFSSRHKITRAFASRTRNDQHMMNSHHPYLIRKSRLRRPGASQGSSGTGEERESAGERDAGGKGSRGRGGEGEYRIFPGRGSLQPLHLACRHPTVYRWTRNFTSVGDAPRRLLDILSYFWHGLFVQALRAAGCGPLYRH
ncbi:hypothetical protein CGCVW01_v001267 [Colletotrichum viniferum]|nr:hypothetical protein CGCVW01_v001267 [Colletotrichum viniferum]